jgi:predicted GTPase
MPRRIVILGAAGRDFHNFNAVYRDAADAEVVAFTATQIPGISGRHYPATLSGPRYPDGIPIVPEADLERLIREHRVDEVIFAYSDVSHEHVMHLASRALAAGADFSLLGPRRTMLAARVPVVAVCAVRTGCGKGAVSRRVIELLRGQGSRVVVVRHPMPYGDLAAARVQRFASFADLDRAGVTLEEREEYEPYLEQGTVVYAGVDYAAILAAAEGEADVIVWDGGNNDLPFFASTLHLCLVDPHRAGHESRYHPGEANLRMADVAVIVKEDTADPASVAAVRAAVRRLNPRARILDTRLPVRLEGASSLRGQRVLAVEDGPSVTHGGLAAGAAELVIRREGGVLVDPRPHAQGSLRRVFEDFPALGPVLPAMGYGAHQLADLGATIDAVPCDLVLLGTPVDLRRSLHVRHPVARARYELEAPPRSAKLATVSTTPMLPMHIAAYAIVRSALEWVPRRRAATASTIAMTEPTPPNQSSDRTSATGARLSNRLVGYDPLGTTAVSPLATDMFPPDQPMRSAHRRFMHPHVVSRILTHGEPGLLHASQRPAELPNVRWTVSVSASQGSSGRNRTRARRDCARTDSLCGALRLVLSCPADGTRRSGR